MKDTFMMVNGPGRVVPIAGRRGMNLVGADLHHAVLRHMILDHADLSDAQMVGADLGGASLVRANLARATAHGADFTSATLRCAGLRYADLRNAKLAWVDLRGADLDSADLEGADLTGATCDCLNLAHARLCDTRLDDINLASILGLSDARHIGPSSVGASTLEATAHGLPSRSHRLAAIEGFLRDCGVSEAELRRFRDMIPPLATHHSCFISYDHRDRMLVEHLAGVLTARGVRVRFDDLSFLPGREILEEVRRAVWESDRVLVCCSESSLSSWWVDAEIEEALAKERYLMSRHGQKVSVLIPLALDACLLHVWENAKAQQIRSRVVVDFAGWRGSDEVVRKGLEGVFRALRCEKAVNPHREPARC